MSTSLSAYAQVLGTGLRPTQTAMLQVALSFFTWGTLAHDVGLDSEAAAQMMARAVSHA